MIFELDPLHRIELTHRNWIVSCTHLSKRGRARRRQFFCSSPADLAAGLIRHGLVSGAEAQGCHAVDELAKRKAEELGPVTGDTVVWFAGGRFEVVTGMSGTVVLKNPARDVQRLEKSPKKTVGYCVDLAHAFAMAIWATLATDKRKVAYSELDSVAETTAREMLEDASVGAGKRWIEGGTHGVPKRTTRREVANVG